MFRQMHRLAFGALCALTLATAAGPAGAHEIIAGRAGAIRNLEFQGNAQTARRVADEFVGLVHSVTVDHVADRLSWAFLARDGFQVLMVADAEWEATGEAIVAEGQIARGALRGAKVRGRVYPDSDRFMVYLAVSLGDTAVAFTQALEPLEAPAP